MSETVELRLYSPLQIDVIDRDISDRAIPLQAADQERKEEYLRRIVRALGELQSQEDARHAFTAPQQDWSEISKKIISVDRAVTLVNNRLYGLYLCRIGKELAPKEVADLKWHCRDQWEHGWGEGYAHCPREGPSLGLYIHFWQDTAAPFLTRDELQAARKAEQNRPAVTEITPDTFWTLIAQAKDSWGGTHEAAAYWLAERLLEMGPEQTLNFHGILHGYMKLAYQYGLWNAAILILEDGCYGDKFEDFRAWLIYQGKETYLAALKDPDSLADIPDHENCRFMALPYVGDMAYERLRGRMPHVDMDPDAHRRLTAELKKGIVYGAETGYPHEWSEIAAYLPRLTARHTTPEELRARGRRGRLWNHGDPDIQKARAAAPKKKKARSGKQKGGESR
nr:DUF4240 domain-containing protein [uncultured Oscillibacter sp.]